jgi:kumamolisin
LAALAAVALALPVADRPSSPAPAAVIDGPYGRMLAEATDLGSARVERVQLTAALRDGGEPVRLKGWARANGLAVRWRPGEDWAVLEGAPAGVADAFGITVRDYRAPGGELFYASPQQPAVPASVRAEVTGLGRVLSHTPTRESRPFVPPRDVPDGGLLPSQLQKAYNATPLIEAGYTGEGVTVVVFSFDGFDQQDMDSFADIFDLPPFAPEVVGEMPAQRNSEATMDLQVIHAVAPRAKLVMVNARSTVEGAGAFERLARLMQSVDERYPGAVWSFSIGWGCDRLFTAADFAPIRAAVSAAQSRGTTAFIASGDLAGLECRGEKNWSDPPSPDDVGVDAVASLPEMTAVGGTSLSTDSQGRWLAEQSWYDIPLTLGSAGGSSMLFGRPAWQTVGADAGPPDRRLLPDISAVADQTTGVKFVFGQRVVVGGGTSQAAPIWAGFAALINEALAESGVQPLGELNPLLYRLAEGAAEPAFRDIVLGGNAISPGGPGYDMVTGLGSPDVDNLLKDILLERSVSRRR